MSEETRSHVGQIEDPIMTPRKPETAPGSPPTRPTRPTERSLSLPPHSTSTATSGGHSEDLLQLGAPRYSRDLIFAAYPMETRKYSRRRAPVDRRWYASSAAEAFNDLCCFFTPKSSRVRPLVESRGCFLACFSRRACAQGFFSAVELSAISHHARESL